MSSIVISQPMFFPWVGIFEPLKIADKYVHYDDVQLPNGRSFVNRVQVKGPEGTRWMTVPVSKEKGTPINETRIHYGSDWRHKHLKMLEHFYSKAKYRQDMLGIVGEVYREGHETISALNIQAMKTIAEYFGLPAPRYRSSDSGIDGNGSLRLKELVKYYSCDTYITGHGARNYLEYSVFENSGIRVCYIDYQNVQYQQLHGAFTPYVSILDLIANMGPDGADYIQSKIQDWRDFINE